MTIKFGEDIDEKDHQYREKELGCKFIRINSYKENFNIF